jgi:hypothetical protein
MSPFLCKKHGIQNLILTSPKIANAVNDECKTFDDKIIWLKIESSGNDSKYYVDCDFLEGFMPEKIKKEVILKDRDKEKKELNNRILILKIFKKMATACPECLKDSFKKWGCSL